ncbi:MAG: 2-oxoacid:acceptor oxidoreductase family protein [Lachnospiraceae bacterium]|nr:2-oxoacid:acceptor oxidoreductase family protein [Lachnospiraceae bacterium]MBR6451389.1 2-oxoacid:acceptor oxidoreductase family protein [Lachnospiraceae bacterium]
MELRMKIAGVGGQGVMVTGKILGYAASDHDKYASFLPQYGTQQRGGTASCTLIISDEPVDSPIVSKANTLVIFQQAALDAYLHQLSADGLLMMNANTCSMPERSDIEVISIPVDDMARELGNHQVANIIMLGAFIEQTKAFTEEEIILTLRHVFESKPQAMPLNEKAIKLGIQWIKDRNSHE